jgi:hypothetical protein
MLGFGFCDVTPYNLVDIVTCFSNLKTGFGLVSRFIGYSLIVTTDNYNTLKITVIITHAKSHIMSSQADL